MPERRMQEGIPIPEEKRSTLFPVAEDNELLFVPEELKDEAARQGLSDVILKKMAVVEFLRVTGAPESEVTANPDFSVAESAYLELLHTRREAQARVSELAASEKMAADTGIAALGTLFESEGTDLSREIAQAKAALQEAERSFVELRDRIREVYTLRKELKASEDRGWSSEKTFQFFIAKQELYSLARRGDALRKYPAYAREEKAVRELEERTDIFGDLVRVRQKAEDLLGEDTESKQKNREEAAAEMIAAHLTPEVERIIDRLVDASIAQKPNDMDESQFRALIRDHVQKIELRRPASVLRANLESKENELATRKGGIERLLQDARNSDLAEMIQEREVKQLLRMYHIEKKRFLPVGAIKEDVESLDRIVSSPRGPILRALLYGPPGTGKTEVLREIGARHGQKVRVISLHETSTFETLVGTQQIPLPKAETLQDAETFWKTISEASSEEAAAHVPAGILEEFSGATPEEKLQDFKGWFEAKLKTARVAAAIGAVSPDDPRVKKAYQEALAAWLDQPLTEGLMNGDLVILDEADRAGNALEGLQDVLTRRPGDMYQPPGRPKSFRIHPEARVAMTANWGDLQTEATAGGGRFSSAIVSRVVEKRKVGYLDSDTEQKLFEIMVTPPESPHRSLLAQDERDAAYALISKVFPKLRDLYLKPGELQFVTPVSVRTLENIARRLVDDTTRTRVKDKSGNPVHFIEAAWQEIASGPFREDQRERILEQLAMIFAEKGIFHNLGNAGGSEPWYLQAARITGIDASRVKVFMGMTVEEEQVAAAAGGIFELPKDFSLGKKIANANRAKNMALFEPLQFTSARGIKLEAERERRRLIEEYGGNYETQERLQSVLRNWSAFDAGLPQEIRDDPEKRLSADVDFLTEQIVGLDVSSGDIQLFVEQLERSRTGSPDLWKRGGLLLSLVVNRFFEFMPEDQWSAVSIELDLKKTPKLDYVGFRLPGGALNIDGELGDYAGRELAGGTLAGFTAGSKTAYGMTKGHVVFESIGDRGGQKMKGGQMEITVLAGERLGMDMEGGKITASTAGARAGFRARGKLIIETAGERLGEELKHGGTIEVESYTSLSNNIRGTIRKKDGTVLVERGSRKGV